MKKIKKILVMLCVFTVFLGVSVKAEELQHDGLSIELTTDKDQYELGESINLDFTIINNNEFKVSIKEVENIIPEYFELDVNTKNKLENKIIASGEKVNLKTKFNVKTDMVSGVVNNEPNDSVDTSDTPNVLFWFVCGIGSFGLFIGVVYIKNKKYKQVLLIFIASSLGFIPISRPIKANEKENRIIIKKTIQYNNQEVYLESQIIYEPNTNEPKNPVEYQDGIKETYLDYSLDEENHLITIAYDFEVMNWKKGEIQVLKSKNNPFDDIAIRVEEITSLDNGQITIKYSMPDFSEIIKSIDYVGAESENGIITPAEGFVFYKNRRVQQYRIDASDSFGLFENYAFEFDKIPGLKLSGKFVFKQINYDIKVNVKNSAIDIEKIRLTLDTELNLNFNSKKEFVDKKIPFAYVSIPLSYGFVANGTIYMYISASGEAKLIYELDNQTGVDYTKGKFKGVWELEGDVKELTANLNVKIGCVASPSISFLKLEIIGGEFEFGRDYEINYDSISLNPLQFCLDVGYYNYANVSAVLLPGIWDKKFKASLMGKDNSIMREYTHTEEKGIVDECTRKYGSFEGQVLKHDGEQYLPLYLATVNLKKDGEEIHTTQTDTKGNFYFDKVIEKGIYDLVVTSNNYEQYQETVEIKGNENNKLPNPIILEPYEKSVLVAGRVYDSTTTLPISHAKVTIEGFENRETYTDYNGEYQIEVPIGLHRIFVEAEGYHSSFYKYDFQNDYGNIDIGLNPIYEFEILEICAGESYHFGFQKEKKIFVRAIGDTEYSSFKDGYATYHETRANGSEFYTIGGVGEEWEIKVFSGKLLVFASDEGFFGRPDSNLSDWCTYTNLNGTDPFIDFELSNGQSLTIDYAIDGDRSGSKAYFCISEDEVVGTEVVTDYWWNDHYGWDINEEEYELIGKQNFWRPLNHLMKSKITVNGGTMTVFVYRNDPFMITK